MTHIKSTLLALSTLTASVASAHPGHGASALHTHAEAWLALLGAAVLATWLVRRRLHRGE